MIPKEIHNQLVQKSKEIRLHVLNMMGVGKAHHFGGSLSTVEIITALYFYKLKYDAKNVKWAGRDRFVMSKGHGVPTQYAALAILGVIPEKQLSSFKTLGSSLQGHPNSRLTPGIEAFTGSLGQGLSYGNGIAMAAKIQEQNFRVYVLLGDGELHEGQIWEAALTSATHKLNNLTAIIDNNKLKSQGKTSEAKNIEPLRAKWEAFGWYVLEVNGHDLRAICEALDKAETILDKPTVIIANTLKGKGVSFMEDHFEYHNISLDQNLWNQAVQEVSDSIN
jgi:transketolase